MGKFAWLILKLLNNLWGKEQNKNMSETRFEVTIKNVHTCKFSQLLAHSIDLIFSHKVFRLFL